MPSTRMTVEPPEFLPGFQVPEREIPVIAPGENPAAIGGEGDIALGNVVRATLLLSAGGISNTHPGARISSPHQKQRGPTKRWGRAQTARNRDSLTYRCPLAQYPRRG
jgi:hypothetical protein